MYVHIGEELLVRTSEIIVILDKQSINFAQIKKDNEKDVIIVQDDLDNIKSVIITKTEIFLSPIASVTLKKRCRISSFQEFNYDYIIT